jgi:uncharacterized membrane protein (UPF0127 family)
VPRQAPAIFDCASAKHSRPVLAVVSSSVNGLRTVHAQYKDNNLPDTLCAFNLTRQSFLGLNIRRADTLTARLRGLLGFKRLEADEGVWIVPSRGVHTIGLLFTIDLVYLDADLKVLHMVEHLRPFGIAPMKIKAQTVLELPARAIYSSRTQVGDKLLICPPEGLGACGRPAGKD